MNDQKLMAIKTDYMQACYPELHSSIKLKESSTYIKYTKVLNANIVIYVTQQYLHNDCLCKNIHITNTEYTIYCYRCSY